MLLKTITRYSGYFNLVKYSLKTFYRPDLGGFNALLISNSFQLRRIVPITPRTPKV